MNNLHLIELGQYDKPTITEETNRDWIGIGDDNDYYQSLIDCFMNSTTNQSVITGISQQIFGRGLEATDASEKPEQFAQMKGLLKDKDLRKLTLDLKMLGEAALQITYKGSKIDKIQHFPRETLRAEKCDENGDILNYYYASDWSKVNRTTELTKIPVFGTKGKGNEVFIIRRYVTGYFYYSPADYTTSYSTLESEISDYLITDAQNSFSGTKVINFNSGIPSEEKMQSIKSQVMNKLSGGFGEKVIVAFNHSSEQKTTVDDIPLNNAPEHYSFLSEECSKKIMLTHRVTSPLLIGLRDLSGGGLGSNAEEIQNAQKLFSNTTIKPYQDLIIESLDEILEANGISLNLYFKTLDPLDFMDIDVVGSDDEIEEETGVKVDEETEIEMLSHKTCFKGLKDEELNILADNLIEGGENEDIEGYELIDTQEATENEDGILSHFEFANVLKSSPAKTSEQDTSLFKVRYKYFPTEVSKNGREFCRKMVKAKKVYRKEDLDKESSANSELAATGQSTYNIWLYKGGANCKHGWIRNIYLRKNNKKISVGQARKMINSLPIADGERKAAKYEDNDKKVAMRPYDMPNHGYKNPRTKKKK
tara:strand:+ start:30 stop:1805 length:1776 start_codon:yes stop_codon:yes gene_type:complete